MSSALFIRDQDIIKQGYLLKQSKYLRQWKQRWIVLSNQYLCSYESQGGHMGSAPTEYLLLKDCTTVRSADEETGRENSFKVESSERTFYLVAASLEEKEAWIGVIGRQMIRPSVLIPQSASASSSG
jgi:hypothetical protein